MRPLILLVPLLLAACAEGGTTARGPVDPSSLPPLSGKEQALLVAADGAARTGNTAAAIRDYQSAIAQSQGHVEAHLALARLYLAQGQPGNAQTVLERARGLQPTEPDVNYQLGKLYLNQDRPAEAAKAFEAGLVGAPNNFDLLNGAGIAHDVLRDHAQAQGYYRQAIAQHPGLDLSLVNTNLGLSYLLTNEPKRAVPLLKAEAAKPGAAPTTRHNLALAYGMLGQNAEARKILGHDMTDDDRKLALERLRAYITHEPPADPKPDTPGGPRR